METLDNCLNYLVENGLEYDKTCSGLVFKAREINFRIVETKSTDSFILIGSHSFDIYFTTMRIIDMNLFFYFNNHAVARIVLKGE